MAYTSIGILVGATDVGLRRRGFWPATVARVTPRQRRTFLHEASVNDWASQITDEDSVGEIERLWMEQRGRAAEILSAQKTRLTKSSSALPPSLS